MKRLLTALALAATLGTAQAGRNCEPKVPAAASVLRAMGLAARTQARLGDSDAQVVVLARAGQDLRAYGLAWSHLGYAYREADGRWRVLHKLNSCGSATAALYRQGLGEFFLDDLFEYRAGFMVLTPALQQQLLPLLRDNSRVAQLNEPAYSMLAYPWAQRYQQSNQWAIETLALAAEPSAGSRERAQAWLQFKGYQPTALRLNAVTRLGARMTAANIAFDDHPNDKRYGDRIETVTVDSVFSWLGASGMAGPLQVVR